MPMSQGKLTVYNSKTRRLIPIKEIIEDVRGEKGLQGPQGVQGERGPVGPKGDKGDTGEQGIQGIQGLQGEGLRIDFTIDSISELETNSAVQTLPYGSLILIADPNDVDQIDNGKVYVVHDNGPVYSFSMAGKEGLQGEQGIQGIQGIKGDKGAKGDVGERGEQGLQGPQGPEGLRGERGEQGPQGVQGAKGEKGDKGDTGAAGKDGVLPSPTTVTVPSVSNLGSISQNRGYVIGPIKNLGFQLEFIKNATLGTSSVHNVFNLPSDLIPISNHYFKTILSDGRHVSIQVLTSGAVNVRIEGSTFTPTTSVYMNISFTYV